MRRSWSVANLLPATSHLPEVGRPPITSTKEKDLQLHSHVSPVSLRVQHPIEKNKCSHKLTKLSAPMGHLL